MKQAAILIVDDNPEIREIIQILLTGEGFQVHEAANGTQALSQLKENIFDLIILDIMMPQWLSDLCGNAETHQRTDSVFKCPHTGK